MYSRVENITNKQYAKWEILKNLIGAIETLPGGHHIVSEYKLSTFNNIKGIECTDTQFVRLVYPISELLYYLARTNKKGQDIRSYGIIKELTDDLDKVWSIPDDNKAPNLITLK